VLKTDPWTLAVGPRLGLASRDYMNTYFSVTPAEAAANGRVTPFQADGGIRNVGVAASAKYKWSEAWSTTVFAGYNRLLGDAGDSPIPRVLGSRDQFGVGFTLAYTFAMPALF
jgi:outer membrane scaffolding protein for murein synthesis (MipA/OmpV family)